MLGVHAPNASESVQNGRYWLLFGFLEAVTLAMNYVLSNGRPELQCRGRLGSRRTPKCGVRRPLPGPVELAFGTILLDFKRFY